MQVEKMLYAYLFICAAMIVFNCVCIYFFRRRDRWLNQYSSRLAYEIKNEMKQLAENGALSESHCDFLIKKMRHVNNLMALDGTLSALSETAPDDVARYLKALRPVFEALAQKNHYHNSMQRAYFAYMVRKYRILEGGAVTAVLEFMMALLQEQSLYCRENALQAIYSAGNPQAVLRALRAMDASECFHHGKLLTDGLLSFTGDRDDLIARLWARFDAFSVAMQIVILDFIRFGGSRMDKEMLALLVDETRDDELRFSCLRYFGKMVYEPAYSVLLDFVERSEQRRWEYAAIAATALGAYESVRTIDVLKQALYSPNWYIRINAAKTLESFHLTYLELSDVMNSGDRSAREILQYQFDVQNAKAAKEVGQA